MGVWQPDFQILLNFLILERGFCIVLTLIGIHRVVLEYSIENFTNLVKKKNGKADKIHFTVLCRWRDTRKLLSWAFPIICLMRRLEKTSLHPLDADLSYCSSFIEKPASFNFRITSSQFFFPRLRTRIRSWYDFEARSSVVRIPARFKQLELALRESASFLKVLGCIWGWAA